MAAGRDLLDGFRAGMEMGRPIVEARMQQMSDTRRAKQSKDDMELHAKLMEKQQAQAQAHAEKLQTSAQLNANSMQDRNLSSAENQNALARLADATNNEANRGVAREGQRITGVYQDGQLRLGQGQLDATVANNVRMGKYQQDALKLDRDRLTNSTVEGVGMDIGNTLNRMSNLKEMAADPNADPRTRRVAYDQYMGLQTAMQFSAAKVHMNMNDPNITLGDFTSGIQSLFSPQTTPPPILKQEDAMGQTNFGRYNGLTGKIDQIPFVRTPDAATPRVPTPGVTGPPAAVTPPGNAGGWGTKYNFNPPPKGVVPLAPR